MSADAQPHRRLVAILAADMVGYSALMAKDEQAALDAVRQLRDRILEPRIRASGGHVFKRMGDGWLATFPTVLAAAECALDVQNALREHDNITMRIGLHLGEVTGETIGGEEDFFGDGINIAARLESVAPRGGIAMSRDAHRVIATAKPDTFHASGPRRLKNIPEPMEVWSWPEALPHEAVSSAKATMYIAPFGGGEEGADLADDLAASLGRQTGVSLVHDEHQARYRLTGTLRTTPEKCRLSVHLADAAKGFDVWRGRLDESRGDVFDRVDRLVVRTSAELRYKLQAYEARDLASRDYARMSVQDLLSAASGMYQTPDETAWRGAATPLRLALERDPGNFMAKAMLASSLLTGLSVGWRADADEDLAEAQRISAEAIASAPNSDFAVFVRGFVLFRSGDIGEARRLGKRALEINAGYTNANFLVSLAAATAGDTNTAQSYVDAALETDVQHPMRHLYEVALGHVAHMAEDLPRSVEAFRRASVLAPASGQAGLGLMLATELAGDAEGAMAAAIRMAEAFPDFDPGMAAIMPYADPDRGEEARGAIASAWARRPDPA